MTNIENIPDEKISLTRGIKLRATCFFAIAALAVVNAAVILFINNDSTYFAGFGTITAILVFSPDQNLTIILLLVTLCLVLLYVFLGINARKLYYWAFISGFFLYAADCLFLILVQDWYSAILHGIILYFIFQGLNAVKEYREKVTSEKTGSSI